MYVFLWNKILFQYYSQLSDYFGTCLLEHNKDFNKLQSNSFVKKFKIKKT